LIKVSFPDTCRVKAEDLLESESGIAGLPVSRNLRRVLFLQDYLTDSNIIERMV